MADSKQKERIEELYEDLKKENKYVAQVCGDQPPEDPLQRISENYNNTFLHMAIRFQQNDLVLLLLEMLTKDGERLLSEIKNNEGNTILHEVASSDTMKDVAEKVLKTYKDKDPELLIARNDLGETPIFCAARYGQTEMFEFLAEEMKLKEQDGKRHLQRDDKTTVLHISITTEYFELAHFIADTYSYLIEEKDQDSMTALQYLACNPTAFGMKKMERRQRVMEELMISLDLSQDIKKIFSKCTGEDNDKKEVSNTSDERCSPTLQRLVELLVEKDTSWHASSKTKKESKIEEHSFDLSQTKDGQESQKKEGQNSQENEGQNSNKYNKSDETPLFLATISGIKEIVEEILLCHPKELEYTNGVGMNILQVAIFHRHIEIFDVVVNSGVLPRNLLSATNDKGNSLLHLVGQKIKGHANEMMQSPAFQLRKELLFFQRVKSTCKMHLTKPLNKDHQTAEELFAASNEELHKEAKEWLMRTTENCTILSVFIATVAFAAAYTVPGGPDEKTGIPILNSKPFFVVFIIADVISLTSALTSVGIFLSILTSSFPLQDFKTYLFKKLTWGIKLMVISVSMMAVAFGATIVLIMTHNWENIVWHVVAFLPVPIFFLSYSPLSSAVLRRCTKWFKKFVPKFLKGIAIAVLIFLAVLFFLPAYGAYKGLRWTVEKACGQFQISGNKSQFKSNDQSPQPSATALTQV